MQQAACGSTPSRQPRTLATIRGRRGTTRNRRAGCVGLRWAALGAAAHKANETGDVASGKVEATKHVTSDAAEAVADKGAVKDASSDAAHGASELAADVAGWMSNKAGATWDATKDASADAAHGASGAHCGCQGRWSKEMGQTKQASSDVAQAATDRAQRPVRPLRMLNRLRGRRLSKTLRRNTTRPSTRRLRQCSLRRPKWGKLRLAPDRSEITPNEAHKSSPARRMIRPPNEESLHVRCGSCLGESGAGQEQRCSFRTARERGCCRSCAEHQGCICSSQIGQNSHCEFIESVISRN